MATNRRQRYYLHLIQTANLAVGEISRVLLIIADKRLTLAEKGITSELQACAYWEGRLIAALAQLLQAESVWADACVGADSAAGRQATVTQRHMIYAANGRPCTDGSSAESKTYMSGPYPRVDAIDAYSGKVFRQINNNLVENLQAFSKAAQHNLNYLEQYFEHDFWLALSHERTAWRLSQLFAIFEDKVSASMFREC